MRIRRHCGEAGSYGKDLAEKSYNANDLKILEGLEAVRVRPGMYIGSTGVKGLHHILWEIVDNAIDEAANGYADEISVTLHSDGSASVEDNGRGMPTDINTKAHMSGVELIFTKLHAGGKFDSNNYAFSGGLHGVGASVTNALSTWLKVEVYRKTVYTMSFKSSYDSQRKKWLCGVPEGPLQNTGEKTSKRGTYVRFMPDKRVFETVEWSYDTVFKRLKELAFLNKGVKINFADDRARYREEEVVGDDGETKIKKVPLPKREPVSFKYDGGLVDFVNYLNEGKTPLYAEPLYYSALKDIKIKGADAGKIKIEFAVCHTKDDDESLYSFVNNISTIEGGYHETGFHNGVLKVVNDYAKVRDLFGELLAEIQRIKSTGDFEAARQLVENYAVKVDPALHAEVLERYKKLNLAPYKGFVNPKYEPVTDADGNITDVKVTYNEGYAEQMLRYSKDYATLPYVNE